MKMKIIKGSHTLASEKGFTLIELLVAVAIAGIVMAGIYSAYYSQQKSYVVQEQVAAMQQNLRAAMYFMEREIRMAGCDPLGSADASIITADADTLQFSEDTGDGAGGNPNGTIDAGENITYSLIGGNLVRNAGGGNQTIAENIEALNFVYLDSNGTTTADINDIRAIQIAIIARSDKADPEYTNTQTFTNMQDEDITTAGGESYPLNDNFRREFLTAQVKCRNLGLEDT